MRSCNSAAPGSHPFRSAAAVLGALAALLTGCARETATVAVHADGSWTRKAQFSMSENEDPKGGKKLTLSDLFAPPSGAGWKVEQKTSEGKPPQVVITATREVGAAETISGDLTVKAPANKGLGPARVVNSAAIRPAGPGRLLYTETFHWTGAKPNGEKDMGPLVASSVRKALPPATKAADVRLLTRRIEHTLWRSLFLPPEPLLLDFYDNLVPVPVFSDPDERVNLLLRRLGPGVETALAETFGARMTREVRHQTAIRLVVRIAADTSAQAGKGDKMGGSAGKSPATDEATEAFGGMYPAAITVAVKAPGRVVETNGLVDNLTGEVYWTLYPQAALEQDVSLRAVFDSKSGEQARLK